MEVRLTDFLVSDRLCPNPRFTVILNLMPALIHAGLLLTSVLAAYFWIKTPGLEIYSLQAFAGGVLVYFLLKRLRQAKFWHIAPHFLSWEMVVATFSISVLVGATGNFDSPLYPLAYVHLFFLILATPVNISLFMTGVLMLFHLSLGSGLSWENLVTHLPPLLTLPSLSLIFLFAKHQHEAATSERVLLRVEERQLSSLRVEDDYLQKFLREFIGPKLEQIKNLTGRLDTNREAVVGQLTLMQIEIEKALNKLRSG